MHLLYLHHCLIELGDKAFESCCYPELSENAKHTLGSSAQYKPLDNNRKPQSSTATEHSLSPYPDSDNFCSRKHLAMEATKEAAAAIAKREHDRSVVEKFDQMMKMRSNSQFYDKKLKKLKHKYFESRDNGETDTTLGEIREEGRYAKKMSRHYAQKYKETKEEIDYESPDCLGDLWSDSSLYHH